MRKAVALGATGALLLGSASAALAAHTDPSEVCPGPSAEDDFPDVERGAGVFGDDIECVGDYEIAGGFTDGEYKPDLPIARAEMAKFIYNLIVTADPGSLPEDAENQFEDTTEGGEFEPYISVLAVEGVIDGYGDNTFGPQDNITRGEMAKFIANAIREVTGNSIVDSENPDDTTNGNDDAENFEDVEPTDVFHDWIAALAAEHIVQGGDTDGNGEAEYRGGDNVLRGEMAAFIMRAASYLNSVGAWAPHDQPTNQTFMATTGGEDVAFVAGGDADFLFEGVTSDTVDVALAQCDQVTNTNGTITFAQDETVTGQTVADFGTVDFASITQVEGVTANYGTTADEVVVDNNDVSLNVATDAGEQGCFVAVVFNDADDDDELDIDQNGEPTEEFGVSGQQDVVAPATVNAEPELARNPFGDVHQVTAQLTDGSGDAVTLADARVRFTVFRQAGEVTNNPANDDATTGTQIDATECTDTSNPVQVETSTTDNSGTASFSYSVQDPNAAEGDRIGDCIRVEADWNADTTFEDTDWVAKNWTDEPAGAAALDLEPDTDTNLVGTQHTVTATVTDQFGDPVDTTVTFEVFRDGTAPAEFRAPRATGTDGQATFTYTGPDAPAEDVIVACVEDTTDTDTDNECGVVAPDSDVAPDEPNDTARKAWVEDQPGAPSFTTASAPIGGNAVTVGYDELVDCATVDLNASNYEVTTTAADGTTVTEREELTAACVTPASGADDEVVITIGGNSLEAGETVRVTAVVGADGNTVLDLVGTQQPVGNDVTTTTA